MVLLLFLATVQNMLGDLLASLLIAIDKPFENGEMVWNIFSHIPFTRLDRARFGNIGQSHLDFEIAYYARNSCYPIAMDSQQAILLSLIKHFTKENIEFVFPAQTLYITRNETESVSLRLYRSRGTAASNDRV